LNSDLGGRFPKWHSPCGDGRLRPSKRRRSQAPEHQPRRARLPFVPHRLPLRKPALAAEQQDQETSSHPHIPTGRFPKWHSPCGDGRLRPSKRRRSQAPEHQPPRARRPVVPYRLPLRKPTLAAEQQDQETSRHPHIPTGRFPKSQPVWRRTPSSVQAQAKPSARAPTAKGTTSSRAVQVAIKKTSFSRTQKGRDRSRPDFYGLISYF
jgi:hypothetical protein